MGFIKLIYFESLNVHNLFPTKLKIDAKDGGDIAKNTRKELEKKIGKSLISKENHLHLKKKSSKHLNK